MMEPNHNAAQNETTTVDHDELDAQRLSAICAHSDMILAVAGSLHDDEGGEVHGECDDHEKESSPWCGSKSDGPEDMEKTRMYVQSINGCSDNVIVDENKHLDFHHFRGDEKHNNSSLFPDNFAPLKDRDEVITQTPLVVAKSSPLQQQEEEPQQDVVQRTKSPLESEMKYLLHLTSNEERPDDIEHDNKVKPLVSTTTSNDDNTKRLGSASTFENCVALAGSARTNIETSSAMGLRSASNNESSSVKRLGSANTNGDIPSSESNATAPISLRQQSTPGALRVRGVNNAHRGSSFFLQVDSSGSMKSSSMDLSSAQKRPSTIPKPELVTVVSQRQLEEEYRDRVITTNLQATVLSDDVISRRQRQRCLGVIFIFGLVVVIITIVAILVATTGRGRTHQDGSSKTDPFPPTISPQPTLTPTDSPTSSFAPTDFPELTQRQAELLEYLISKSFDDGRSLQDHSSPQVKAFRWLAGSLSGGVASMLSLEALAERYAYATFYFSTNGTNWHRQNDWLNDNEHICGWNPTLGLSASHTLYDQCLTDGPNHLGEWSNNLTGKFVMLTGSDKILHLS